jgi:hypothetical protein
MYCCTAKKVVKNCTIKVRSNYHATHTVGQSKLKQLLSNLEAMIQLYSVQATIEEMLADAHSYSLPSIQALLHCLVKRLEGHPCVFRCM